MRHKINHCRSTVEKSRFHSSTIRNNIFLWTKECQRPVSSIVEQGQFRIVKNEHSTGQHHPCQLQDGKRCCEFFTYQHWHSRRESPLIPITANNNLTRF